MPSPSSPPGQNQKRNQRLGCGCLSVLILALFGSCLATPKDDRPPAVQAQQTQAPPPVTASPTTTAYAAAAPLLAPASSSPARSTAALPDRACGDFASRAVAQAAVVPGEPGLDPDSDGLACENYRYGSDDTARRPPVTQRPATADDGSGSGSGSSSGTKPRTGNSGHPCRPGERDGDGDGYCGEGR